jgi:hypothetical protein
MATTEAQDAQFLAGMKAWVGAQTVPGPAGPAGPPGPVGPAGPPGEGGETEPPVEPPVEPPIEPPPVTEPPAGATEIPTLNWTAVPSDWINVKSAGAKGDGVSDDTAAINNCLSQLTCFAGNRGATVYIPAGTYRITGTLNQIYKEGSAVIGHGKGTVLVWDGPDNGCMFNSDSNAFSLFEGLVFDGKGRAANGLKHGNIQRRVIMTMHRNLWFKDFRAEAIHIPDAKPDQRYVAESMFQNILIERAKVGISMIQHNDYINSIAGCTFLDVEIGVKAHFGLPLIRDCHFERCSHAAVTVTGVSHGRTMRRCTAKDVGMLLRLGDGPGWKTGFPMQIQDCHVEGWKNVDGAIIGYFRGPIFIFDSTFKGPPSGGKQTILLGNGADYNQRLLHSNCTSELSVFINRGANGQVSEIPAGARGGSLTSASQSFLRGGSRRMPGKVFSIKDYGAVENGADIGPALQQAIDAAKAEGNWAMAYVPPGEWNVSTTAVATGGQYVISGSGWKTKLWWKGAASGGVMLRVKAPQDLIVQNTSLGHDQHGAAVWSIHQVSDGTPSRVLYDNLHFRKDYIPCGLFLDGLGAGDEVIVNFAQGRVWSKNSSRADIICSHMDYCSFYLEGAGEDTGMFGVMAGFTPGNNESITVKNNLSFVASDLYTEAQKNYITASGADGEKAGRITCVAPRFNTAKGQTDIQLNNYQGRVSILSSHADPYGGDVPVYKVMQTGSRKASVVYAGIDFLTTPGQPGLPTFELSNGTATVVGNIMDSWSDSNSANTSVPDQIPATGLQEVAAALDHLRELGDLDLRLNFGWGD